MSDNGRKDKSNGSEEDEVQQPVGERTGFASGRMTSAAIPMEKSLDFTGSVKRLLRRMRHARAPWQAPSRPCFSAVSPARARRAWRQRSLVWRTLRTGLCSSDRATST